MKKKSFICHDSQIRPPTALYKAACKSQHTIVIKDSTPSPTKPVRKQTRMTSSVTKNHQFLSLLSNPTYQLVQQCITTAEMIKERHRNKQVCKFFHVRSCSMPCPKIQTINNLLDSIIDEQNSHNQHKDQRNLESEIQSVMNQLLEEKKQKQKALLQEDSMQKQQDLAIQYLKAKLLQF